ncbi:type II toxin-antitoxin system death-on-curing family toxin [Ruegeria sp. 2012CJ41-6]|uniref:Type II toxin-antitoxin system death-on-curing family toxin n=1 Tax=Ruegeria spongiae TaxID=2942209 RepID=A0ABT0QAJ4_9RHOB|nr:type II toxin-antitoxin system death-on-curing family toxin [Ruegeria spongiae]MCL6286183.1 type II toxin-antitoxin system death-on-curing family toxin [Ruegeria spongiae]
MSYEDVLDVHFSIVDFFRRQGYGLGGIGIKDLNTFISTVERQFAGFGGHDLYGTDYEKIATLVFGIIKNHPFYDGNKRSAFLCALLQLHKMGKVITVSEKEFEDLMVEIANDSISRKSALQKILKKGETHPEIRYLGRYLEKNSRKVARLNKTIKFRQLKNIVESNGFQFKNCHKGTIDLVQIETRTIHRFWFSDKVERKETVLATIAYHGDGVDVPDNTLKLVRQKCGLSDQDGFDGEVLLRDAQPTFQLINSYRTALQNLAYR